jgi:hypothetical protein
MTYDPCNPVKTVRHPYHHPILGRIRHHRHGLHHQKHPYHHIVTNGCPKVSVLDTAPRFGALPGAATVAKLTPIAVVAGAALGSDSQNGFGGEIGGGYYGGGGYVGGGSGTSPPIFVCTKYTQQDKRCQHITQVPEPASVTVMFVAVAMLLMMKKTLSKRSA